MEISKFPREGLILWLGSKLRGPRKIVGLNDMRWQQFWLFFLKINWPHLMCTA